MALVVLAMAVMFRPVSRPAALLLATGLLVANAYVRSRLRGACSLDGARLVARQALVTDIAGAVATYALFLFDPQPTPIAFIPFLVFEFTVRFGARGSATGLVLFFASLGFRMHAQSHFIEGGFIRPPLVLVWTMVALVMVAFARELRAQETARLAAMEERERIAGRFRTTVGAMLERSGIAADAATRDEVLRRCRGCATRGPTRRGSSLRPSPISGGMWFGLTALGEVARVWRTDILRAPRWRRRASTFAWMPASLALTSR